MEAMHKELTGKVEGYYTIEQKEELLSKLKELI